MLHFPSTSFSARRAAHARMAKAVAHPWRAWLTALVPLAASCASGAHLPPSDHVFFENQSGDAVTVYVSRSGVPLRIGLLAAGEFRALTLGSGLLPAVTTDLELMVVSGCPSLLAGEAGRCRVVSRAVDRAQLIESTWTFSGQRLMASPRRQRFPT
ncbi:MAG: hypothetical protein L0271_24160 [Gemmatimonadetes bacterium]|nr:hypothetical protein [Gemmatimonadota bacterium]